MDNNIINLEMYNFYQKITQIIDEYGSSIPASSIYFVLKNIFQDIEQKYLQYMSLLQLEKETEKMEEQLQKKKEENNEINFEG